MTPRLPRTFGRYVLTELLGEGGMAEVYRAGVRVAEGLTKWVVIKRIRRDFADQSEFTRMFVDEAKIALSLNHANIVQVFDFGQVRGDFYLAMELIEGLDLMRLFHAVRTPGDAFPAVIGAYIGHQVASGLAYAHRKRDDFGQPLGIVHRDVSPHNVMISWEGQVKILDFGIARARGAGGSKAAAQAEQETIKGKVAYMSPEQALGRPLDARSDLYSLGVLMYELLTGDLLYRGQDRLAALEQVRTQSIPPILERAPDLPDELARIVDRALARDVADRYASARELQMALADFLHRSDPVVDDTVLSQFLERYRGEVGIPALPTNGVGATREMVEGGTTAGLKGPWRSPRRVVLLEVRLRPPPEGVPQSSAIEPFHEIVRDVAFKRDAVLLRHSEQSVTLIFGAVLDTEDNSDRTLRAAIALREAISEAAPGWGIGQAIAEGYLTVTSSERGEVEVEVLPAIARTMSHFAGRVVDGPVLIFGEAIDRIRRRWRLGPDRSPDQRTPLDLDGTPWAAAFQRVAELQGPRSEAELRHDRSMRGRAQLVGRELELKSLRDAFSDAIRNRRSRALLLLGDPGLGKRTLLERFIASLPRGACHVLRGVAQWSTRNQPLWAFVEMVRRFLQLDASTPLAEIQQRLEDLEVAGAPELAQALYDSIAAASGEPVVLTALERRDRIRALVRRLVRSLSMRRPLLLVMENLHLLDQESADLLSAWAEHRHELPVLGIVTSRRTARADALASTRSVAVVELRELDEQARRSVVLDRFEDPEEAKGLAEAIVARSGGHPLFIEEIMASLIRKGMIAWNAQGRQLVIKDRDPVIDMPPSVEAALQLRVDDLTEAQRQAAQGGAILGRSFRAEELAALVQRPVDAPLATLIDRDILELDPSPGPDGRRLLRFCTVTMHELVRDGIPPATAAELHSRAADIKLARADYRLGRDDGPIADHLVESGRIDESIDPALRAARYAAEGGSNSEAYYFLSGALRALSPSDPRRFDVFVQREPILRSWGRRRAQGADLRQLVAIAEATSDPEQGIVAYLRLLRFYLECGRIQRAAQLLPRVTQRVASTPAGDSHRLTLAELESDLEFARGDLEAAKDIALEGIEQCDASRVGERHRARLLACVGRVFLNTGRFVEAQECFQTMVADAHRLGDRRLEAEALDHLGRVAGRRGLYQDAVDHLRTALAIDRELGDRFATGTKLANLGIAYTELGMFEKAERYLRKALELHEAVGHPGLLNDAMVSFGVVYAARGGTKSADGVERGDPEGASNLLQDAASVAASRGDLRTELRARVRLAQVRRAAGDLGHARELATDVLLRARRSGHRTSACRALLVLSMVAEEQGQLEDALSHASDAVDLVRAGAAPIDGVLAIHQLGHIESLLGLPGARAHLREAAKLVGRRLESLRDDELREAYLALPEAQRILADDARLDDEERERSHQP